MNECFGTQGNSNIAHETGNYFSECKTLLEILHSLQNFSSLLNSDTGDLQRVNYSNFIAELQKLFNFIEKSSALTKKYFALILKKSDSLPKKDDGVNQGQVRAVPLNDKLLVLLKEFFGKEKKSFLQELVSTARNTTSWFLRVYIVVLLLWGSAKLASCFMELIKSRVEKRSSGEDFSQEVKSFILRDEEVEGMGISEVGEQ